MKFENTTLNMATIDSPLNISSELFLPNNHSNFLVNWKDVESERLDKVRKILLEHFGLGNIEEVKQVDEWEVMSNNFRIKNGIGENSKYLLLRKNIVDCDVETLNRTTEIVKFLRTKGLPVPQVIFNNNGQLVSLIDGNYWQLFEFINGNHFKGATEELKEVARHIANMHQILDNLPVELSSDVDQIITRGDLLVLVGLAKKDAHSDFSRVVTENTDFLLREIELVEEAQIEMFNSKKQPIHWDLHPLNTLFEKGKLVAIIDFGEVNWGYLGVDISNALHRFVRQFVLCQRGAPEKSLINGVKIFLDEYYQHNPEARKEINLLSLFMKYGLLKKIFYVLNKFYQGKTDNFKSGESAKLLNLLRETNYFQVIIKKYEEKK